jgi:WD40 repeat protein
MAVSICPWKEKNESNSKSTTSNAIVTVGLSDNSVEFYKINCSRTIEKLTGGDDGGGDGDGNCVVELLKRVVCTDRCLLYSMDLFLDMQTGVCYVAGGTIFLDVVIWQANFGNLGKKEEIAAANGAINLFSNVIYRLKGHEGSIHSVRWSPSGTILASGSDDRTVRIWDILENSTTSSHKIIKTENGSGINGGKGGTREENGCNEEILLTPRKVLYGHGARLWGFYFTQDESIVISCSEDRTCKFWNIDREPTCAERNEEESLLKKESVEERLNFATLKGHRFRGIWHCCLSGSILYTGGADGAIKAWNLWDVLQPEYVERILDPKSSSSSSSFFSSSSTPQNKREDMYDCPWMATSLQCNLPDPESTTVGTITLPSSVVKDAVAAIADQSSTQRPKAAFDSSSEWVRCLAITKDHSTVFVGTNRGLVHQVQLPVVPFAKAAMKKEKLKTEERWLTMYKSTRRRPITSMTVVEEDNGNFQNVVNIFLCDISGYATVLTVENKKQQDSNPAHRVGAKAGWSVQEWLPYNSEPVSGIHFLRTGLLNTHIFTTGPQGKLTLWQLRVEERNQSEEDDRTGFQSPKEWEAPLRVVESCCELKKSTQIVDIDIIRTSTAPSSRNSSSDSTVTWLVAAGTSCGAVVIWRLKLENDGLFQPRFELQLLSCLNNVHLGSPVRSISLTRRDSGGLISGSIVLESCGSNGAIVRFLVHSTSGTLSIMVEEHYDALLIVAGKVSVANANVESENTSTRRPTSSQSPRPSQLVYGFQSTNFVVWDAKVEAEVCSIYCGSWRRPWAVQISAADMMTFCCDRGVGGTKINVYTRRPLVLQQGDRTNDDSNQSVAPYPRALLPPGHGREINAVGIRALGGGTSRFEKGSAGNRCNKKRFACFTGGEDSSVRQTLVDFSKNPSLREINCITDHVGGTTVKSLTLVDFPSSGDFNDDAGGGALHSHEEKEITKKTLMVTGGSKKVLMAWIIQQQRDGNLQNSAAATIAREDGFHCQFVSAHAVQNIISCKNLPSVCF